MRTRQPEKDGRVTGFSVSNLFLDRHGVPKVVASIPGAEIVRRQPRFQVMSRDDFCEFTVEGKTFWAIEPFGDNSEFWIVGEPPEDSAQLSRVREAFSKHRVLFGLYAG